MTGTNCDLFTHSQFRSYLNHLVHIVKVLSVFLFLKSGLHVLVGFIPIIILVILFSRRYILLLFIEAPQLCKEREEWKRITEKAKTHNGL
jgi:hypothetical protein